MFYFVLNNEEIQIVNAPVITEDLNKDLDTGELTLQLNRDIKEINPRTPFILKNDDEVILSAIITSDEVNVMEKDNNLAYSHKITYEESIGDLKYYQVRNSVFSQPGNNTIQIISSYNNASSLYADRWTSQSVLIPTKAKIKQAYFEFKVATQTLDTAGGYSTVSLDNEKTVDNMNIYVNDVLVVYQKSIKSGDKVSISTDCLKTDGVTKNKITKFVWNSRPTEGTVGLILIAVLNIEYYYYTLYDILDILKKQTELSEE